MRLAVSVKDNQIAEHFGHCDYFEVFEIENNEILQSFQIKNPPHQKGFLPQFLKDNQIDSIIVGGIGTMAVNLMNELGIQCFMKVSGEIKDAVKAYVNGTLNSTYAPCEEHH